MTADYFTEDQKLLRPKRVPWTMNECSRMSKIAKDKGYQINVVSRFGCDRQAHDAWHVPRKDVPRIIEQLFRQRIPAEVQAEGHGKASVIFVYDHYGSSIINALNRFQKNKGDKL